MMDPGGLRRAAAVLLSAWLSVAIGPIARPQEDSGTVERERVRVVRLSILAVDRRGQPVSELGPEDLEVTLRGTRLEIAGLDSENHGDEPDENRPDVRLQIEMGNDISTRRTSPVEPRYWMLFIDIDNDLPGKLDDLASSLGAFVENSLRRGDFISVVSYNGTLHVDQTFTTDFGEALGAIREACGRPRTSGLATDQRINAVVRSMDNCRKIPDPPVQLGRNAEEQEIEGERDAFGNTVEAGGAETGCVIHGAVAYVEEMRFRSDRYYEALENGVRLASGMPGAPTVLAVSHGVTVQPEFEYLDALRASFGAGPAMEASGVFADDQSARRAFDRVLRLARNEGVSLYFVDPSKQKSFVKSARQDRLFLGNVDPVATAWLAPQRDLQLLGDATGGTFFSDTEVAPSLMGAVERERARMLLDLYVPGEVEDAALWDIQVRSTNKEYEIEGTRFRLWPWAPPDLHAVGGVHLGEQRARHGNRPGKVQMFQLGVRLKDMDYEREGDDMVANFSLGVRIETGDGRQLVDSPHVFRHAFPVARWDAAGDSTLGIRGFLEAPPGDYKLVAEFRNTKTRKTGLIVQEIHIP